MTDTNSKDKLPDINEVAGFPIDANMQWSTGSGSRKVIRVFYRYRSKEVPPAIQQEMDAKIAEYKKAGKKTSPELRRYIGEVVDNVFYPKPEFKAHPELFPVPKKANKGLRVHKLAEEISGVYSSQHAKLINVESTYDLNVGSIGALLKLMEENYILEDLRASLNEVFGEKKGDSLYPKVLTYALFMACTGEASWKIEQWITHRAVPCKLTSSQVNALLNEIGKKESELRNSFSARRFARNTKADNEESDFYALDGTNAETNARKIGLACIGMGKNGQFRKQIVLSYLYSTKSQLPVTYQPLPGNMTDKSSLSIFKDLWKSYNIEDSAAVSIFDRGYFNTDDMIDFNIKKIPYIIAVKTNLKFVQDLIPEPSEILNFDNKIEGEAVFGKVFETYMRKGDPNSKVFLHVYFSPEAWSEDIKDLDKKIDTARMEWLNKGIEPKGEIAKYFESPVEGKPLKEKKEVIKERYLNYGYFAFISNVVENCSKCLARYGLRNGVEVCFKTSKTTTGMSKIRVHNDPILLGKVFVNFISVMAASAMLARMRKYHIPYSKGSDLEGDGVLETPLSKRTSYSRLLQDIDHVFIHKESRCAPIILDETDKVNKMIRQLRLPDNLFSSAEKIIDLITKLPDIRNNTITQS